MILRSFFNQSLLKKIISFLPAITILMLLGCKDKVPSQSEATIAFKSVDSLLTASVDNQYIPGAVAFVSHKGEVAHHKAYGYKTIEDKNPLTTESLFRMASMTKALTAVAILQLMENGQVALNDPVKKYHPEFSNLQLLVEVLEDSSFTTKPAKNEMTIQQLLTHTSGIGYGFQNEEYNKLVIKNNVSEGFCEDDRTSLENTKRIAALPLLAEPGEKNIYSMSYDVLGTIVEVVSGMRYDDYISKHILEPLGMKNSYFLVPENQQYRMAQVYEPGADNKGLVPTTYKEVNYPILTTKHFYSGGSDLVSTAGDYNKFLMMLVNQGTYNANKILNAASVAMMLSPQTSFNDGDSNQGFAAWMVNEKGAKNGLRPLGSYDFGGFFDTYCWVDPEQNFTAILLVQMYPNNAHDVHWEYQKAVYRSFNNVNNNN